MEILIYFISIGLNVTGQHYDQQDERLTSQLLNQSGHCPLTCRYFKPCKQQRVRLSWSIFVIWTQYKLLSRKKLIPQWKSFWVYVNSALLSATKIRKQNKLWLERFCTLFSYVLFKHHYKGKNFKLIIFSQTERNCITCIVSEQSENLCQFFYLFKIWQINVSCPAFPTLREGYDLRPPTFFILISRLAELKDWITR